MKKHLVTSISYDQIHKSNKLYEAHTFLWLICLFQATLKCDILNLVLLNKQNLKMLHLYKKKTY